MAARTPRRSFANPFVITLAALPAVASCIVEPAPRPVQPQPGSTETAQSNPRPTQPPPPPPSTISNPPPPTQTQPAPAPRPGVISNPPRPTQADPAPAPPPTPAPTPAPTTSNLAWNVTRSGSTCVAAVQTSCPTAPAGHPQRSCNPPMPRTIACPDGLADGGHLTIVQYAGDSTCTVQREMSPCPKGVMCNPPPPRPVACPQ